MRPDPYDSRPSIRYIVYPEEMLESIFTLTVSVVVLVDGYRDDSMFEEDDVRARVVEAFEGSRAFVTTPEVVGTDSNGATLRVIIDVEQGRLLQYAVTGDLLRMVPWVEQIEALTLAQVRTWGSMRHGSCLPRHSGQILEAVDDVVREFVGVYAAVRKGESERRLARM